MKSRRIRRTESGIANKEFLLELLETRQQFGDIRVIGNKTNNTSPAATATTTTTTATNTTTTTTTTTTSTTTTNNNNNNNKGKKVKVNFTLEQATKVQRGVQY